MMNFSALRRHCLALAGRVLSTVRYRGRPNPYRAFGALPGIDLLRRAAVKPGAPRVLLAPIRVSSTSNLVEALIGAGLKLDGCEVYALLDGGSLRHSENQTFGKSRFIANTLSVYEQQQFCKVFGIAGLYYDDVIDFKQLAALQGQVDLLTLQQLFDFTYRGVLVGQHARAGLMRFLRQETVDRPENLELLRGYVLTGLRTALAVEAVVRSTGITHAFLSHGIYSTWGVATDILVLEGVTVSVWGRGYVGGKLIFGRNQSYLRQAISDSIEDARNAVAAVDTDVAALNKYFLDKSRPGAKVDVVSYYDASTDAPKTAVQELEAGYDAVVCVFPNIPWDGTMFSASRYTPSLRAFAAKVVEAAQAFPRVRFIVRCHPAEIHRMGNNSREAFSSFFSTQDRAIANLLILESNAELSSYDLLPICDAALIFGTTLGLELLFRGVPVLLTGKYHLSNKGVLYEVGDDVTLHDLLERVQAGTLVMTEAMRANTLIYGAYHINLCHVEDDMLAVDRYRFKGYKFDAVADLGGDNLKSCNQIKRFVLGETRKCLNPYA